MQLLYTKRSSLDLSIQTNRALRTEEAPCFTIFRLPKAGELFAVPLVPLVPLVPSLVCFLPEGTSASVHTIFASTNGVSLVLKKMQ